jgi:hypothetical protein
LQWDSGWITQKMSSEKLEKSAETAGADGKITSLASSAPAGSPSNTSSSGSANSYTNSGSGFGGSVTALRLTEKGYRVGVLEAGRRFEDKDFAVTSWRIKDFLFAPALGLYGIQRIHLLPDAVVLCGAGVGGGSLVYANTLYVPPSEFDEIADEARAMGFKSVSCGPFFRSSYNAERVYEAIHARRGE